MKNGDLYVLHNSWEIDTVRNSVVGEGEMYNYNRRLLHSKKFAIPIDSVAIFETNKKLIGTEKNRIAALTVLAALDVTFGIICVTVPKACFGSCPTFYTDPNDNFHDANAEGFSNAVVPAFEYTDIDDIKAVRKSNSKFSLWMKNEALETHCVKDLKLKAIPTQKNETALQGVNDNFYICGKNISPTKAMVDGEDITDFIKMDDRIEWRGESDSTDLSAKQEVILDFDLNADIENVGLSATFRQSLLVTHLFYSAMGYAGNQISDLFAELETNPKAIERINNGVKKELGNIEVFYLKRETGKWINSGFFYEEGPIARNKLVLALGKLPKGPTKIKLVVSKGFWRIDQCELIELKSVVEPVTVSPSVVHKNNTKSNTSLNELLNPKEYLISMPGDEYELDFELPQHEAENYTLFLASTGYYLEWMRQDWLKDQDWSQFFDIFYRPKHFLKQQAPLYKKNEAQIELDFWNSKIDTKTFSYD